MTDRVKSSVCYDFLINQKSAHFFLVLKKWTHFFWHSTMIWRKKSNWTNNYDHLSTQILRVTEMFQPKISLTHSVWDVEADVHLEQEKSLTKKMFMALRKSNIGCERKEIDEKNPMWCQDDVDTKVSYNSTVWKLQKF